MVIFKKSKGFKYDLIPFLRSSKMVSFHPINSSLNGNKGMN